MFVNARLKGKSSVSIVQLQEKHILLHVNSIIALTFLFSSFLSRVLRDSISHFSVGPLVRRSVGNKVVLKAFYRVFDGSEWQRRILEE